MKGTNLAPSLISRLRENTVNAGGLHHLDLSNSIVGPREVSVVGDCVKANLLSCEGMAPLISMDLSGNQICGVDTLMTGSVDSSGLSDLLTVLTNVGKLSRLRKIILSRNYLSEKGFVAVSLFLTNGPTSLTDLEMRNCGGDAIAMERLFQGVKASKSLTFLDVRQNKVDRAACKSIGEVLASNSKLKQLLFNECSVGPDGAAMIMKGLQSNMTLEVLGFGDNNIRDAGAEAAALMLKSNQRLRHLDLQENDISNSGAAAIAQSLTANRSLVFLGLQWNDVDNDGAFALSDAIRLNGGVMRSLHIVGTRIDIAGIAAIIESGSSRGGGNSSSATSTVAGQTDDANAAAVAGVTEGTVTPNTAQSSGKPIEVDLGFAYYNLSQMQNSK